MKKPQRDVRAFVVVLIDQGTAIPCSDKILPNLIGLMSY